MEMQGAVSVENKEYKSKRQYKRNLSKSKTFK